MTPAAAIDGRPPGLHEAGMARGTVNYRFEQEAMAAGARFVCGIDEAGRGPWAGPVVAAAVCLDPHHIPHGIDDSKALRPARREQLFLDIMAHAHVGIAAADVERIDRDNILAATLWAMGEALRVLTIMPDMALVDGNRAPALPCRLRTVVSGDAKCLSIAAASIVAKVTRDHMMAELDVTFPHYGFAQHKGYGTPLHSRALKHYGPCQHHRRSFAPVKAALAR